MKYQPETMHFYFLLFDAFTLFVVGLQVIFHLFFAKLQVLLYLVELKQEKKRWCDFR